MSNNPWSGRVPLNYRPQETADQVKKAVSDQCTSYRPGEVHPTIYRTPHNERTVSPPRQDGNTPLRRYPDGRLDVPYVAHKIIEICHKMKDGGNTTDYEKALLCLVLPQQFKKLIDPKIAQTMTKLSKDERFMLAMTVDKHRREELNWNAGMGGGSVPGRGSTRS
jgi:hypothetical protein